MSAAVAATLNDQDIRRVLNRAARLPRYTSYPTADRFHPDFNPEEYLGAAADSNQQPLPAGLSLYLHVPFCHSLCFYCGCHKVVTRRRELAAPYLKAVERELHAQAALFDDDREVDQIHLGGGTPTWLSQEELGQVMTAFDRHFSLDWSEAREFSIEIDPRSVDEDDIRHLVDIGFNRFSFGVQDLDPLVQQACHRVLSAGHLAALVETARENGVASISFDLIYGLPHQQATGFRNTIDTLAAMAPERLSIYRYAHLPERFRAQRLLQDHRPDGRDTLELFLDARRRLLEAGYQQIGLDHFSLADDELARAWRDGSLQRNFQGYSTRAGRDLVGIGPSAISHVNACYAQNRPDIRTWQQATLDGLSIARGYRLTSEDRLRADIVQHIMCRGEVDLDGVAQRYQRDWRTGFRRELAALDSLAEDGLLSRAGPRIQATALGRLALRVIAAVFDAHLDPDDNKFSRAV